mmetsp:Transcript_21266/g.68549  ORF Transcript_21266/g.68549 Transcript_21266/m.68549 type:complete len:314 (+) Transcript_21266:1180-2121(+)
MRHGALPGAASQAGCAVGARGVRGPAAEPARRLVRALLSARGAARPPSHARRAAGGIARRVPRLCARLPRRPGDPDAQPARERARGADLRPARGWRRGAAGGGRGGARSVRREQGGVARADAPRRAGRWGGGGGSPLPEGARRRHLPRPHRRGGRAHVPLDDAALFSAHCGRAAGTVVGRCGEPLVRRELPRDGDGAPGGGAAGAVAVGGARRARRRGAGALVPLPDWQLARPARRSQPPHRPSRGRRRRLPLRPRLRLLARPPELLVARAAAGAARSSGQGGARQVHRSLTAPGSPSTAVDAWCTAASYLRG